jgi:16S rRNA (cytidine1402-2'-O)-methyltransferase
MIEKGTLYVVATPIGNLGDITYRAIQILSAVDRIAAEDTRHSRRLLQHYGISTPCVAYHEHNERQVCDKLVEDLTNGATIALISDAGTPLVSDPGFPLVRSARAKGLKVIPIPGPSALIAALSVSGLPCDRFIFEGFLPAKSISRQRRLQELKAETRTMICYESPHRIVDTMVDLTQIFGPRRRAVVARELTKTFETVASDTLEKLSDWVKSDANQQKGEFVLLVHGAETPVNEAISPEARSVLEILASELPVKQAAALAARITGVKKNVLYQVALQMKGESGE